MVSIFYHIKGAFVYCPFLTDLFKGESVPIFYTSHTEKPLILWAWENDETKSFLYEWDWSREPIEPGTYTLQVIYRDGEGGIQLHLTLEGALTVVAP